MKYLFILVSVLALLFSACATTTVTPTTEVAPAKEEPAEVVEETVITPAVVDFGEIWTGNIIVNPEDDSNLPDGIAIVTFDSEWTTGENAGNVYPKQFISLETGQPVELDGMWDKGGKIPAGTYDVKVDVDGNPGSGWVRNLTLKEKTDSSVIIHFNAAKLNIELNGDGEEIYTYPAGTHDKYEGLGRLNDIPGDIAVTANSSYTENNQVYWLIPSVPLDVEYRHADGSVDWFLDYTAVPESFINQLP